MAWKYLGTTMQALTPALAEEFMNMPCPKNDRDLKPKRYAYLSRQLESGRFIWPRWGRVFIKESGARQRVNGKHTSTLMANANGHFPKGYMALVDEFECDTEKDAADLFELFDPVESARTTTEAVTGRMRLHEWTDNLDKTNVRIAVSASMLARDPTALRSTGRASPTRHGTFTSEFSESLANMRDWIEFYCVIIPKSAAVKLRSVAAAICTTYAIDPDLCLQFWTLAIEGSHQDFKNATRTLNQFILRIDSKESPERRQFGERGIYAKCITAWNAWRRGETTQLKYHDTAPLPKAI